MLSHTHSRCYLSLMPMVSIIMCAYNCEAYIGRAIESIINQTYHDWELIISDDCSTDNTTAIVEAYKDLRIRLVRQPYNLGYLKNKNAAFGYAAGNLLTQLDADDTCPPLRIEKQVAAFHNPEVVICGTNYNLVDANDRIIQELKEYQNDYFVRGPVQQFPFWYPGLMFRRTVMNEFGLFSEYFTGIVGDDEYWTYRINSKYPIYFVKDVLYNYRIHGESLTNVYDKPRKMLVAEILTELFRQRKETGTDMLEKGEESEMRAFEERLLADKKLMAEKYRLWAAKAIDKKQFEQAGKMLTKSFAMNMVNPQFYKTLLYYTRRKISG